jgi:hypothetical protein
MTKTQRDAILKAIATDGVIRAHAKTIGALQRAGWAVATGAGVTATPTADGVTAAQR